MRGLIGLGIALIVIGLILTFSNLFGIVLGGPLIQLGWLLVIIGVILAIVHFFMGRRTVGRRTI